jgi:hypothetical protein
MNSSLLYPFHRNNWHGIYFSYYSEMHEYLELKKCIAYPSCKNEYENVGVHR